MPNQKGKPMEVKRTFQTVAITGISALALAGCGAGSQTASSSGESFDCTFDAPEGNTTVNVLAYNSPAIDPYSNVMVNSCSKDGVNVVHEPIDFAGQVQRTQTTLGSGQATYDIIETYGFIIPGLAESEQIVPLNDLIEENSEQYALDEINQDLIDRVSFEGEAYGLPMQAQSFVLAYREDVFDEYDLEPPTTFEEMRDVSAVLQDQADIRYPLALPFLASSDIATAYVAALGALGKQYVDEETMRPNFDTEESKQALTELKSLMEYMDPQVLTFDQPTVQQQMFNGDAAMSIMFSGRMADLVDPNLNPHAENIAFATPPKVTEDSMLYSQVSVDAWSIPHNTGVNEDLLFNIIAASTSREASEASIPAAYPARQGVATEENLPFAPQIEEAIAGTPDAQLVPWAADMMNETINVVGQVITGQKDVDSGAEEMQRIGENVMERY